MTIEKHDRLRRLAIRALMLGACVALTPMQARAGDLPSRAAAPPAPVPAPATSWTGLYLGVAGGYAFDAAPTMALEGYSAGVGGGFQAYPYATSVMGANAALNNRAFVFSPNVGYNYQAGNWVFGGEISADLPVGGDEKSVTFATPGLGLVPSVAQIGAGWTARYDATGKLGFMLTPQFMFYAGGGPSLLKTNDSIYSGNPYNVASGFGQQGAAFAGWHAKGGVEFMAIPGWSIKLEYDHADWGSHTVVGAGLAYGATPAVFAPMQSQFIGTKRFTEEKVSIGLAYHTNFLGGNNGLFFVPTGNIVNDVNTLNGDAQNAINGVIGNLPTPLPAPVAKRAL